MNDEQKQNADLPLEANKEMGGARLDPGIPAHVVDQYAGDSIDELRRLEQANQHLAQKEISQSNENS